MIFELERAHGMSDVLERIGFSVRVVVHGINAPLISGAMMLGVAGCGTSPDRACSSRRSHINFGAQHSEPSGKSPAACVRTVPDFLLPCGRERAVLARLG